MKQRGRVIAAAASLPAIWLTSAAGPAHASTPNVLLVGTYNSIPGTYSTIQAAVNAAQPGDWILVGPGDYHETNDHTNAAQPAGVYIKTAGIHLRGMNRNTVVVDGTKTGASKCSASAADQDFGPLDPSSNGQGRNGIEVYGVNKPANTKFLADNVSIENLTVCNFLNGSGFSGSTGNGIWWNGGDGSGQIGMNGLHGAYLSATTTYTTSTNSAQYGIFTSNEKGPGDISHTYASNMGDSAYYIGACPDCNMLLDDAHGENSALGYSGTNGGGHLIIQFSEFDQNRAGIVPNTLNNDDAPSPQNGACPSGTGPTGTSSCMVVQFNNVHDNNNPNTPGSGIAGVAPIGSGIELAGGQNDIVQYNHVYNQGGWGIIVHDFPDTETPPPVANCAGGTQLMAACYFTAFGNEVAHNFVDHNGGFNNPTNGDLADDHQLHNPGNCWHDSTDSGGTPTSDPPMIQTLMPAPCFMAPSSPNMGDQGLLTAELACASGIFGQCPTNPAATYPSSTGTTLLSFNFNQPPMPDPCAGVPANVWCPSPATVTPEFPFAALPATAGVVALGGFALAARVRSRRRAGYTA